MVDICKSPFSLYTTTDNLVQILLQLGTLTYTSNQATEPLNECFDFTDEFNHSEVSHYAL